MGKAILQLNFWIFLTAINCLIGVTLAQQKVNLLFFYEDAETQKFFNLAKDYVNDNVGSLEVEVNKVYELQSKSPSQDAIKLIQGLCARIDEAVKNDVVEERPDFVLDFTRQGIPSEAVKVITKTLQIPTISGTFGQDGDIREWRDLTDKQKTYLIQISPPADIIIQAFRSIVDMQKMKNAVVFFDDKQYEMYHKYKSLLQDLPTRHILTKIDPQPSRLRTLIDRLVDVDFVNFFIAGKTTQIETVLEEASQENGNPRFTSDYAWYSTSMEPGIPKCTKCSTDLTIIHLTPKEIPGKQNNKRFKYYTDNAEKSKEMKLDCLTDLFYLDLAIDAILAVGKVKALDGAKLTLDPPLICTTYNVSAPMDELNVPKIYDELVNAAKDNILPFELGDKQNGRNYPIFDMEIRRLTFETKNQENPTNTLVGTWTPAFYDVGNETTGFVGAEAIQFADKENLNSHKAQMVYRVVTVVQPPFVYWNESCAKNETDEYHHCFMGYAIDLLNLIKDELKFKYTIRNVTGYGYMNPESNLHEWDGLVRELKDRNADIGVGAIQVMVERETAIDFTFPYYEPVGHSILMKKPVLPTSLFKFLTVLENDVWMCILGAYFFTSFLMWVFDRWSPYSYQNNKEKFEDDEEKREFNLRECLWFCITSLTPQGGGEAPKNLSGRLVAATWWLFGFIIIASYTANLAAFLTVSRLDAPIESLQDLIKQYKVQYAPEEGASTWIYFDRMAHIEHVFYETWKDMSLNDSMTEYERAQLAVWDYPISDQYTKIWQAMQENIPPKTYDEAISRVLQIKTDPNKEADLFAFLGDATDIKYEELTRCEVRKVGEEFSRKPYALAVQKGSPLREKLDVIIRKYWSNRQLEQLKVKWWDENPFKPKSCPKDDNQSEGISIHNIGGVFIVIFVGFLMTFLTLTIEYWWYKKRLFRQHMTNTVPQATEFVPDYNTQFNRPSPTGMPQIENSW